LCPARTAKAKGRKGMAMGTIKTDQRETSRESAALNGGRRGNSEDREGPTDAATLGEESGDRANWGSDSRAKLGETVPSGRMPNSVLLKWWAVSQQQKNPSTINWPKHCNKL
jgi:hypothetical protein